MNFWGGCCIVRYGGSGGGGDMLKVDRIMFWYCLIVLRLDFGGFFLLLLDFVLFKLWRGKRKYLKENSSSSGGFVNSNGNSKWRRNEEVKNGFEIVMLFFFF